jgi:uncharacterized protein (TIGR02246 family)
MSRHAVLAVCLVLGAAPAMAQTKAMIQRLEDEGAAAFKRGDAKAIAAMYTKDAYMLPPGAEMIRGRKAIEAQWRRVMQHITDFKCKSIDVKPLGPSAAREIGICTFKTKGQNPHEGSVKYAIVWQKIGGKWEVLQDIWNANK